MHYYNFEKLDIWNLAMDFANYIYDMVDKFPHSEKYSLNKQLTRSASSIAANIAEGDTRFSKKDKARFFQIAYGSAIESLNHVILANRRNYINKEDLDATRMKVNELTNKINAFHKKLIAEKKQEK